MDKEPFQFQGNIYAFGFTTLLYSLCCLLCLVGVYLLAFATLLYSVCCPLLGSTCPKTHTLLYQHMCVARSVLQLVGVSCENVLWGTHSAQTALGAGERGKDQQIQQDQNRISPSWGSCGLFAFSTSMAFVWPYPQYVARGARDFAAPSQGTRVG